MDRFLIHRNVNFLFSLHHLDINLLSCVSDESYAVFQVGSMRSVQESDNSKPSSPSQRDSNNIKQVKTHLLQKEHLQSL